MTGYIDIHTHLTHKSFDTDREQVIARAKVAGLTAIVVNGLEPKSNRMILEMAQQDSVIKPALGIYPLEAICHLLPEGFELEIGVFDVQAELKFIRESAQKGLVAAIGECGLDGHYLGAEFLPPQEAVFEQLIGIALEFNLPLIIHTRKCERRAGEILAAHGVKKVDFHCFGGRSKMATEYAEKYGWCFSIPANCTVNQSFQKMLQVLPPEQILTETDAPYLPPMRGERNEPANVVGTVRRLAEYRNWTVEDARDQIFRNFQDLFSL